MFLYRYRYQFKFGNYVDIFQASHNIASKYIIGCSNNKIKDCCKENVWSEGEMWRSVCIRLLAKRIESWDQWVAILCDENKKYNAPRIDGQVRFLENGSLLHTLLLELQDLAGDCCK
jgi:hypothetical protein